MHTTGHDVPVVVGFVRVSGKVVWTVLGLGGRGGEVNDGGVVSIYVVLFRGRRRHSALE